MPIPDKAVVIFDYDIFVDGEVIETTSAEVAAANKLPLTDFKPMFVEIGAGQLLPALEADLKEFGETVSGGISTRDVILAPEAAFGHRKAELLQTVARKSLPDPNTKVGDQVNTDQGPGIVTRIGGGRATVDMNHRYAGKTLTYRYMVREVITDPLVKVDRVLRRSLGDDVLYTQLASTGNSIDIVTPARVMRHPKWLSQRDGFVESLRHHAGSPVRVTFTEIYPAREAAPVPVAENPIT